MPDVAGNSSTTATIALDGSVTGSLETIGDQDWFRIELQAGQVITISMAGAGTSPLEDPLVVLRNASGLELASDDDSGSGRDAKLNFTVTESGTYYIDAGAWEDGNPDGGYIGTYTLSVGPYVAPVLSVWTNDQIANQLTIDYWSGQGGAHRFNVSDGGSLTVNLTGLTAAGQFLARNALALWTDVIGVRFNEVSSGGSIVFDDDEVGANANAVWSGGFTSSATVNVGVQWITDYGSSLRSYSFQTYVHEIGHALGLGHAGDYNGEADYATDAMYLNDSWSTSIMSYFDQNDNTYFANLGFSNNLTLTPMVADIVAVAGIYGLSSSTRLGNTTYGFNSTADRTIFDATKNGAQTNPFAYTIIDSGGVDTLDYSGYAADQVINLNQDTFSNIGGDVGNVAIAIGTIIENAVGGAGNDRLTGNAAGNRLTGGSSNDILDGGPGADRMEGGLGDDVYHVDSGADLVVELAGQGIDIVYSSLTWTLAAAVENLILTGTSSIWGMGQSGANVLTGNAADNRLYGYGGDDRLNGGAGNDRLDGGAGGDVMYGGKGHDIYIVDNAFDYAMEAAGEGVDIVYASVGHSLRANVERLVLMGGQDLTGAGNLLANIVSGNGGDNRLYGLGGEDRLYGGAGNDRLDGGAGADHMSGGEGNDIYFVDNLRDFAAEYAGEGTDVVYASVHHVLRANVERLYLRGTDDLVGKGNDLGNIVVGNSGANRLYGFDGNDRIYGGAGNDLLDGGNGNDRLEGDAGSDKLYGGNGADILVGEDGNDWLQGGAGRDRMYGGQGADRFVFDNLDFGGATTATADQVHDFDAAEGDRISLALVDANILVSGDQAFAWIGTDAFSGTAGELRTLQGSSATFVQGDTNGDGVADFLIRLDGLHSLGTADFIL